MTVEDDANAAESRIAQIYAACGGEDTPPALSFNPGATAFQALVHEKSNTAVTSGTNNVPVGLATTPPADLDEMIKKAATDNNVDPNLIRAVAKNESGFNPNATSPCGAKGEMQLMDGTAAGLGVSNSYDAQQNFQGGAKYLHGLLNEFNGDLRKTIAAYNAGPGAVKKYGGVPPYAETQAYVNNVLGSLEAYQAKAAAAKAPDSAKTN